MHNQLLNKMRELSIQDLKERRHELFDRTRKIMDFDSNQNTYDDQDPFQEIQSQAHGMVIEAEVSKQTSKSKSKKKNINNKVKRYWRKLMQVSDWMVQIPENLLQFYVAVRPDANKCLMSFTGNKAQIRDKSGKLVLQIQTNSKIYKGTILEVFLNIQSKYLVISDLISWKHNPMTSSQFEFRYAWMISNLNIANLVSWIEMNVYFIRYEPCKMETLQVMYEWLVPYQKEGLIFVHKDSPYLHGLNPNVLIWKDLHISKYLRIEIQENKNASRGVGFLNKQGQVKSIQNITLFKVNRQLFNQQHRFIKFTYKDLKIDNIQEDKVEVLCGGLDIIQTIRNYDGPIDSLGKLLHKCKISQQNITIQQLVEACVKDNLNQMSMKE